MELQATKGKKLKILKTGNRPPIFAAVLGHQLRKKSATDKGKSATDFGTSGTHFGKSTTDFWSTVADFSSL
jgi:hypothetical protein